MGLKFIPISRFIVSDGSMEPNYQEGDHVLTFNWTDLKKGDVVVFQLNRAFILKRITKIVNKLIYVEGDSKNVSAKYDPIKNEQIIGKVIFKY